jgi:hypothetical protein
MYLGLFSKFTQNILNKKIDYSFVNVTFAIQNSIALTRPLSEFNYLVWQELVIYV